MRRRQTFLPPPRRAPEEGERGILERVRPFIMGRPKAWEFGKEQSVDGKLGYHRLQQESILATGRQYNPDIPVVKNLNFNHTNSQICMPYGFCAQIDVIRKSLFINF